MNLGSKTVRHTEDKQDKHFYARLNAGNAFSINGDRYVDYIDENTASVNIIQEGPA